MSVTFALVAGEASGDILGAGLIRSLREQCPDARFTGIGGPLMIAEGFESLFPMDRLSVMGIVEVLGRLKELLGIRRSLREKFTSELPAIFIGIDAPDFNLPLERSLREAGVTTMHYVSPSVWAWRRKRIFKIRDAVDHMLCLLPFEAKVYRDHGVPVTFVGHPLADEIALEPETPQARKKLRLAVDDTVIGILPGSRSGEVRRLAPLFLDAARKMQDQRDTLKFLIPCANVQRKEQLEALLAGYPGLPVTLLDGQSHEVMAASDALLMASGTAALEGLLHKKPMVISYRMNGLSYAIIRRMVTIDFCSLPNLLAGKEIVPEILQEKATPQALCQATLSCLDKSQHNRELTKEYYRIHRELRQDASARAADAVMGVIGHKAEAEVPAGETV